METLSNNSNIKNKSKKINNLRVLAIILVVLGHSIIIYSSSWDLYKTSNKVIFLDYFKKIIDIIPMPLFFAISGYLFYYSHKKYHNFIVFTIKKFKRLMVPFFCVGIFYLLPIRRLINYPGYIDKTFFDIFISNFLKASDIGHLWYLPALFFTFLISEVILFIFENIPYICEHIEIFFMIISIILYFMGYRIAFSYPPLMSSYSYIIWFSLGYFVNKWNGIFNSIYNNKLIIIILVLTNIIGLVYCGLGNNVRVIVNLGIRILTIINLFELIPNSTNKLLDKLGENSFGIYLFHSPLVYITFTYIPNINPLIMFILNFFVFGLISLLISLLIRNTKFKFILGE